MVRASITYTFAARLVSPPGRATQGAAEFQEILDRSGIAWNCWTGALAHLVVARANALEARASQGDSDPVRVRARYHVLITTTIRRSAWLENGR